MTDGKNKRRRQIGGKTFLELRSLSFFAAYLLTTSVVSNLVQASSQRTIDEVNIQFVGLLVTANLISFAGCLFAIVLIKWLFAKTIEQGMNLFLVFLLSFMIGSLKGAIVSALGITWGLFSFELESASYRWVQTGILGMMVLPLLSLTVFKMHEISENSQALLSIHLNSEMRPGAQNQLELNKQIQNLVDFSSESLRRIEQKDGANRSDAKADFLEFLDVVVDHHLRPISHKLWNARSHSSSQFTAYWALGQITRANKFSWYLATALLFFTLLMSYLQLYPVATSIFSAILSAGIPAILAQSFRLAPKNMGILRLILISTGALIGVPMAWVLADLSGFVVKPELYTLILTVHWLLIMQNIVLVSLASSIFAKDIELRSEVQKLIENDRLTLQALKLLGELERRHLAEYLHSEVQNRLLATSLQMNSAAQTDLKSSIAAVRSAINEIKAFRVPESKSSWEEIRTLLMERWAGFLDIGVEIDEEIAHLIPSQGTCEMLNESVANSLRHGLASMVSIRVVKDRSRGSLVTVEIRDNGIGATAGKMGLGHKLAETLSAGNWRFKDSITGGATLELWLPENPVVERPR